MEIMLATNAYVCSDLIKEIKIWFKDSLLFQFELASSNTEMTSFFITNIFRSLMWDRGHLTAWVNWMGVAGWRGLAAIPRPAGLLWPLPLQQLPSRLRWWILEPFCKLWYQEGLLITKSSLKINQFKASKRGFPNFPWIEPSCTSWSGYGSTSLSGHSPFPFRLRQPSR